MNNPSTRELNNPVVPWWLALIEGIAAIIVGLLLLVRPAATLIVLIQFLGIYWLVTGIFTLISLFWDRTAWGWKLFIGIVGILAGILIIQTPLWSALLVPTTLAIVIGIFGIIIGLMQLIEAFRGAGWGTGILGVLSILLGILLLSRPVIAGLALPWMLGILLVVGGVLALFVAFALRGAKKEAKEAADVASATGSGTLAAVPPAAEAVAEAPAAMAGATQATAGAAGAALAGGVAAGASAAGQKVEESAPAAVEPVDVAATNAGEVVSDTVLIGNVDLEDATESAKFKNELEYVEGIGPVYAGKLKAIGLVTCLDLLRAGASRKGREEITEKSGISHTLILKWVNHVDLYRIKGVGSEYADLLEIAGVDTVVELAQRNPTNLFKRIIEVNIEKDLVRRPPSDAEVEDWVAQAKGLPRVITY